MLQQITGDFSVECVRDLGQRLQPGLPTTINADLQRAFHAATIAVLHDIGGKRCFPAAWRNPRPVPAAIAQFHDMHVRRQNDALGDQACDLLHTLVKQVPQLLLPDLPPAVETAYRQAQTLDELAQLFFDHSLPPIFDQPDWADLRCVWPEFERHVRRHLFGQVLVHFNDYLKHDTATWRAFTLLLLEGTRASLNELAQHQQHLAQYLPSLQRELQQLSDDPAALGQVSAMLAAGLQALGRDFSTHLDRRLDDLTTLFERHFQLLRRDTAKILEDTDAIKRHLKEVASSPPPEPPFALSANFPPPDAPAVGRAELLDTLRTRLGTEPHLRLALDGMPGSEGVRLVACASV